MKTLLSSLSCLSLSMLFAACSGGSGPGGDPAAANVSCDPGDYRPQVPAGLGVAGVMNGTWRVTASELMPDARTRNPELDEGWLGSIGTDVEFRDGLRYFGDVGGDPGDPGEPGDPGIPGATSTVEFYCNEQAGGLTLYGFGVRFSAPSWGNGATRQCAIFGTTGPRSAVAVIVEEQVFATINTPGVDRFMAYRVTLEKL
ncbi:MAG: hypothetical protein KDC98_15910 [Planctomycetes bacterium]|nr:hypothetical protein [Planctomycetota bacterium]